MLAERYDCRDTQTHSMESMTRACRLVTEARPSSSSLETKHSQQAATVRLDRIDRAFLPQTHGLFVEFTAARGVVVSLVEDITTLSTQLHRDQHFLATTR